MGTADTFNCFSYWNFILVVLVDTWDVSIDMCQLNENVSLKSKMLSIF